MFYYSLIRGDDPSHYEDFFSPDRTFDSVLDAIDDGFEFIKFYLDSDPSYNFHLYVYSYPSHSLVKKVDVHNEK